MNKLLNVAVAGAVLSTCLTAGASSFFDRTEAPQTGYDLKTGFPVQTQDAYAVPAGELRLQSPFIFDRRVGDGNQRGDVFTMVPEIQYGVAQFTHLRLQVPVYTGSGPTSTSGDIVLGGFYNFLDETNGRPAMGISADLELPTGTHSRGVDPIFYYYVTKSLGSGPGCARVHANIGWVHNSGSFEGERENFYVLRLGYSQLMFGGTVVALDFVRQKLREQYINENVFELGAQRKINNWLYLNATLGAGVGDTSPEYRIGGGVQIRWH